MITNCIPRNKRAELVAYLTEQRESLLVFRRANTKSGVFEVEVETVKVPLAKKGHDVVGELGTVVGRRNHSYHPLGSQAAHSELLAHFKKSSLTLRPAK